MRNYAGTCKGICSYNLVYNFLIQLLPLKNSVFVVHFSNAFSYGNEAFAKVSSQNEIVPLLVIFHFSYCENMFLLVSLSKSKIFTCVALMSFVQYSCLTRVVRVTLVLHLCCTRVARASLVSLVSHLCCSCRTHVARVWLSCCKLDQIVDYMLNQMFLNQMRDVFLISGSKKAITQFQIVLRMISKIKIRHISELQ